MPVVLEKEVKHFVRKKGRNIEVNWEGIARLKRKIMLEGDYRTWQPLFENLLDYLYEKRVLTYSIKDSWAIICRGTGVDLSPSRGAPCSPYHFKRRKDAEDYSNAFYSRLATRSSIERARDIS